MTQPRSPSSTSVTISELMTPEHANFLGKVFGGSILALLDKCAYVTASRFAGTICVTASFERVDFHSPIEVGELVHLTGTVDYVGRTSLQVRIEVEAENIHRRTLRHTNSCIVTMVAIDEEGRPTPVPRLHPQTREEKLRFLAAAQRRKLAQGERKEQEDLLEELARLSDEALDQRVREELEG